MAHYLEVTYHYSLKMNVSANIGNSIDTVFLHKKLLYNKVISTQK